MAGVFSSEKIISAKGLLKIKVTDPSLLQGPVTPVIVEHAYSSRSGVVERRIIYRISS
jgi:hypothetical protein